jgi:hypothetical protein
MTTIYRAILGVLFVCSVAVRAHAQGAVPTAAPNAIPEAKNEPWAFSLGATGSYQGNALFTGPGENKEFSHYLNASIGRSWELPRGGATLNANANQPFYQESTSLNDFTYGASGSLSYSLTRRLRWFGSSSISSGFARDSQVLNDSGLFLPSVTARSSSANSTFAYAMSRSTNLSWNVFESGVGFASALFVGGTTVGTSASLTRQLNKSQTIGVSQEYGRTFTNGDSTANLATMGTWSAAAPHGWTLFASGGLRPYTLPDEGGYRFTYGLSGGFTKPVRPGQVLGVSYDRGINPSFSRDGSNNIVQTLSGHYSMSLVRNLSSSFGGSYSRGTSPLLADLKTIGEALNASLTYKMMTNLNIGFGAYWYGRTDQPSERVTSYGTYLSASYSTTW